MYLSVTGLLAIVAVVFYQVFGRYVLNSSPTWTENLALVLILYVTLIGAAVGVRDAGHIGMDSLLVMLPDRMRERIEFVIHLLVAAFGARHGLQRLDPRRVGRNREDPESRTCRRSSVTCRSSLRAF